MNCLADNKNLLYRYRSTKDMGIERIFTHNELYFSSPLQFNDPFDCQIHIHFKEEDETFFKNKAIDIYKKNFCDLTEEQIDKKLDEDIKKQGYKKYSDFFKKEINFNDYVYRHNLCFGICTFSAVCNDILMYSHYSDGHKGFCLVFNKENEFFKDVKKIIYPRDDSYPDISSSDAMNGDTKLDNIFIYKSNRWDYEKEFRIIKNTGSGIYNFPEESLLGVIFGCKMKDEDKLTIMQWAKKRETPLHLFQAGKQEKEYRLDINPLDMKISNLGVSV